MKTVTGGRNMNVTIRDIAKMANVSIATVSRYMNNPNIVSENTRMKIATAIEETNYKPNEVARGLSSGTSRLMGILLPAVNNIFFSTVILGIEEELSRNDYTAFVCNTHERLEKEIEYIDILMKQQVAGLIFMGTRYLEVEKNKHIIALNNKIPVMLVNDRFIDEDISYIMTDETEGIYKAVKYLYELGHRKIYFFNGNKGQNTYQYKQRGFMNAVEEVGIQDLVKIVRDTPFEMGGYNAMQECIKGHDIPTAVVVASDQMAIGVIRAAHENGIAIPKDISIIGFDNTPISGELYPKLTTVNQKPHDLGVKVAKLMIEQIESKNILRSTVVENPEILERNSVEKKI